MSALFKSAGHPASVEDYLKLAERLRLPQLLAILIIVVLAYQLAGLSWRLWSGATAPAPQSGVQPAAPVATSPRQAAQQNFAAIANHHLFGQVSVAAKPVNRVVPKQAPVTKLNLVLHGVFAEADPTQGSAIIGKAGGEQRFYRIGESLGAGTSLAEVYDDHVLLERNGSYEALYFPEGAKKLATGVRANSVSGQQAPATAGGLGEYRDILQGSPQKIMEYLQFIPVKIADRLEGFRVLPKQDRNLFNKLGITQADIITAVNGIPVAGDAPEIPRLLQELAQAQQLVLTAKRHGREQTITVEMD